MTAPVLLVLGGKSSGRRLPLVEHVMLLGRDPRCQITLSEMTISRRHARLERHPQGYYLEDLGSTAGTQINGRPLAGRELLRDGDILGLGEFQLAYCCEQGGESWAGAPVVLNERQASTTIEHSLVGIQPEMKLAAILGLARVLGGGLDSDQVLANVLDELFGLFPAAQRGLVLLDGASGPRPAAARARPGCTRPLTVSRTIYEQVAGRGKAVLIQDVEADHYLAASRSVDEACIRTIMAVPLRDHAKRVVGLLQLDTSESRPGFAAGDLDLLAAIAVQVGLAVDNARLLDEARREQRRLELLAAAGEALAASLDLDAMLGSLARLAVPTLADLCVVDIRDDDGAIRRVATAHADPTLQPLADQLLGYPPDPAGTHPAIRAMRDGQTVVAAQIEDAELLANARDDDHRTLVIGLACRCYVCVPLVARGRTLGTLSLVGTRSGLWGGEPDLALAEELARRAATAADNARLFAEAERTRLRAEDASRAKDRLIATLSHELRTPLTPVLLTLGGLLDDPGTPGPIRPALELCRRGVKLEARLIDDLLDATRAGSGKLRLERRPIDAHVVVREASATCREIIRSAGLRLELDLNARNSLLEADPARLQQVVWNLLKNAAKFTPAGGTITVRSRDLAGCECRGDGEASLVIEVTDTGSGIESELLGKIFDPFEQGGAAREGMSGGLGLGLAIARGIAEAHGGQLKAISSGLGHGSTFTLELPASAAPAGAPDPARRGPADRIGSGKSGGFAHRRILVVEDDEPTRSALSGLLRRSGAIVATASSLAEARAAIDVGLPDVIVSDLGLPDGSGLELASWLRGRYPIPAIALSGYGSDEDQRQSREAGFKAHLTKPIDFRSLEVTIRQITDGARDDPDPIDTNR